MEIVIYTQNASLYNFIKNSIENSLYYRLGAFFSLHPAHPRTPAELIPLFRTGVSYLVFLDTGKDAALTQQLSALHSKLRSAAFFLFSENEHTLLTALRGQLRIVGFHSASAESLNALNEELTELLLFLASGLQHAARGLFIQDETGCYSRLAYDDIYCVELEEKRSHYCLVRHTQGSCVIRSSIKALLHTLDYRFSPCSSSCIINLQYVKRIDLSEKKILLENGCWYYFTTAYKPLFRRVIKNQIPLKFQESCLFFPH
ncbi:MAG: LytTR family DNA-binding domain-containing protein [Oscillospiraceae bacterium]|nr:LytTR family DNA-binding domain-containing protein [Oscillospiraceae bacterium]